MSDNANPTEREREQSSKLAAKIESMCAASELPDRLCASACLSVLVALASEAGMSTDSIQHLVVEALEDARSYIDRDRAKA